ncbi:MAG: uracil phosphoribosyltransferase [Firmicutes bacterium]|nr:uracil phosphoribosyltransferase [Bacillota bacterium]MCL1953700.1 uracil phosphoribosyltransferase [Bacillota bacterium]
MNYTFKNKNNPKLRKIDHCLVTHKVSLMRSVNTGTKEFREYTTEIAHILGYEALRDLPTVPTEIVTPLQKTIQNLIIKDSVVLLPILRAGLGMQDGLLTLLPTAAVGYIGMYRDHDTSLPNEYYFKAPELNGRVALILDPMLATGGSICASISLIKKHNPSQIKVLSIVSAPKGIDNILNTHQDVEIYTAAIDDGLNEHNYIVPGLGDAGDRLFGTK